MASNNVVAACIAHIANHNATTFGAQYGGAATPAQVATACGYPGNTASAWRKYVARQHGVYARHNGGRYAAATYGQWCSMLGLTAKVATGKATPKQAAAAASKAASVLTPKLAAASAAAATGSKAAATASTPASAPPASA